MASQGAPVGARIATGSMASAGMANREVAR
jgi:hypothetical protein